MSMGVVKYSLLSEEDKKMMRIAKLSSVLPRSILWKMIRGDGEFPIFNNSFISNKKSPDLIFRPRDSSIFGFYIYPQLYTNVEDPQAHDWNE